MGCVWVWGGEEGDVQYLVQGFLATSVGLFAALVSNFCGGFGFRLNNWLLFQRNICQFYLCEVAHSCPFY